jgi:hypothetical protein
MTLGGNAKDTKIDTVKLHRCILFPDDEPAAVERASAHRD